MARRVDYFGCEAAVRSHVLLHCRFLAMVGTLVAELGRIIEGMALRHACADAGDEVRGETPNALLIFSAWVAVFSLLAQVWPTTMR